MIIRWLIVGTWFLLSCQPTTTDPLVEILSSSPRVIQDVLTQKDDYEIQIVYTQIDRDENNAPQFRSYSFNYDENQYFYPASTVKMPVAFLSIEKINELKIETDSEIDLFTNLLIDSSSPPQTKAVLDTTSKTGLPNVAHYIEKLFSISDNDAYNRLYEFVGQDRINSRLREIGAFSNSRIRTRVGITGFSTEDNQRTNPFCLTNSKGDTLICQGQQIAENLAFDELTNALKGIGYYDDKLDSVVMDPFDMSEKNFINLKDLELSLMKITHPEAFDRDQRFNITEDQYRFLYRVMKKYPRELPFLADQTDKHYDSYVKFFIHGDSKEQLPDFLKIFNKVGWAYGYLTDCSYIIDTKNNIEFFLTATIHVNSNRIYNDGLYEYEEIGLPFLAELGRQVYHYELDRFRDYRPNLSKYLE